MDAIDDESDGVWLGEVSHVAEGGGECFSTVFVFPCPGDVVGHFCLEIVSAERVGDFTSSF